VLNRPIRRPFGFGLLWRPARRPDGWPHGRPWLWGPGYGGPGYGGYPPQGGGGSGILGTLATGAAAGAGFAAGERLIDGMFGGHDRERIVEREVPAQRWDDDSNVNQDMGGNDFGISDAGSWDDGGSSGGGDDW
jgi:hypothetical protein